MDEARQSKGTSRRKLVTWIVLCITIVFGTVALCGLFLYFVHGYRLTPLQAAKANTHIPDNADLITEEISLEWGRCYLLETPDRFFMAGCEREGPFWRCTITSSGDNRPDDGLTTLAYFGWGSDERGDTIFAVQISDPQVAYVEAGEGPERIRQFANPSSTVVFQWNHTEIWLDDLAAHALDGDGRLLYEYRYADKSHADSRELRWYPVADPSEAWYPPHESPESA